MRFFHLAVLATAMLAPVAPASSGPLRQSTPAAVPAGSIIGPAFYVTDIARSLAFYRDGLGMTVRMKFGPKEHPDVIVGFGPDLRQPSLMLLGDRAGPAPRKVEHVHGFDRITLGVPDLHALQAKLRAAGYKTGEIQTVHGAILMMMTSDPDGYAIELIQMPPANQVPVLKQ